MERAVSGFRTHFPFSNLPLANWFPGHMAKGIISNTIDSLTPSTNDIHDNFHRYERHCKATAVLWLHHWSARCKSILTELCGSWSYVCVDRSIWDFVFSMFHNSIPHIPFSGRNPNLNYMLRGRPKLLVLNKMDLADSTKSEVVYVLIVI